MGAELRHEFADDYPARLGWVPRLPLKQDLIASERDGADDRHGRPS